MIPEIWVSVSGGKDSTYLMQHIIENQISITGFVSALIQSGEEEDIVEHIYSLEQYAKQNNYPFIILQNHNPIEQFMGEVVTDKKSKLYGTIRGFPLKYYPCWISRDWKYKLLHRFEKQREAISRKPITWYLGYAIDEPSTKRQEHKNIPKQEF